MSARNDYLPSETEYNSSNGAGQGTHAAGQGTNGNGNGHQKVFKLAPVESPEDIVLETVKKIAPRIRAAVHFSDRLTAAAKFFFDALLDLSFMHCYGGSGRGKIFISTRDLSRLLKHDKDSIAAWREELSLEKLIWFRASWPKSEWRICALCPAPETDFRVSEYQTVLGKAAAQAQCGNFPHCDENAQKAEFPRKSEAPENTVRKESPHSAEDFRQSDRILPTHCPTESPNSVGNLPTHCPTDPVRLSDRIPQHCPDPSDSLSGSFRTNKETPKEYGSIGASGSPSKASTRVVTRSGEDSGKKRKRRVTDDETEFMAMCLEVFGPREMAQNGGMWRERYLKSRTRAWAALRDTREKKKDPHFKPKKNWAAYCTDLFMNRFA